MPRRQRPRSVWDREAVLAAFDDANIKHRHYAPVVSHLLRHSCESWDAVDFSARALHGVPHAAQRLLRERFEVRTTSVAGGYDSSDGATTKLAVKLHDGAAVETVLMRHDTHVTVCVSSQVGCAMQCSFCATGTMGILGDLSAGEIVEQVVHVVRYLAMHDATLARALAAGSKLVRNTVFMGMGEPLNNYSAVCAAVGLLVDRQLFAMRRHHVTVSTVGIVPKMLRFAADLPGVSLALSLHAPTQAGREAIMPAARTFSLPRLLAALDAHLAHAKRSSPGRKSCMIEYIMMRDVNDGESAAHELGRLLAPRREDIMVNLIPYNPTDATPAYRRSTADRTRAFQLVLRHSYGLLTCRRQTMGDDIAGACGQLVKQRARGNAGPGDIEDLAAADNSPSRRRLSRRGRSRGASAKPARTASGDPTCKPGQVGRTLECGLLVVAFLTAAAAAMVAVW